MARKTVVKVSKSFKDGHVALRVEAGAHSWGGGETVSASVSVDLDLATAKALQIAMGEAIEKEAAKVAAKQAYETRRKKWRDREIAAGRMQVFTRLTP